jgi:hypothetical protein
MEKNIVSVGLVLLFGRGTSLNKDQEFQNFLSPNLEGHNHGFKEIINYG